MKTTRCDYLIIGAGCAGLSLAVHLVEAGLDDKRLLIVDPRLTFPRDRTWCFWNTTAHPFEKAVSHTWHRWRVASPQQDVTCESSRYAYHHIAADDFYALALNRLHNHPNVELRLGERVLSLHDRHDGVMVETTADLISAQAVFDSRPSTSHDVHVKPPEIHLLQHFVGAFVQTRNPVFTPDTVTLMDFQVHQELGLQFMYVLPFGPHDALVESTFISPADHSRCHYEQSIREYLHHTVGETDYQITDREYGILPMCSAPVPRRRSRRVTAIGLAGGMAKPSSGYAFLAIQKFSAELAARLCHHTLPEPPRPRPLHTVFLDRVFLSFINRYPEKAPDLFAMLFAQTQPESLVRFLSDEGSLTDTLQVMWAMPKFAFAVEALKVSGIWPRT